MTTTPQTLTLAGEDYVVIPRDEYERLRAAADEHAAAVAAIPRVLDDPDETWVPAELVRRIVEGEHPVRVWRTPRAMTARSPAVAAGIPSSHLSAIERGVKPGSLKALRVSPPLSTCGWTICCDRFTRRPRTPCRVPTPTGVALPFDPERKPVLLITADTSDRGAPCRSRRGRRRVSPRARRTSRHLPRAPPRALVLTLPTPRPRTPDRVHSGQCFCR